MQIVSNRSGKNDLVLTTTARPRYISTLGSKSIFKANLFPLILSPTGETLDYSNTLTWQAAYILPILQYVCGRG